MTAEKSTAYCPAAIVEAYKAVEGPFTFATSEQAEFFRWFGDVDWSILGDTIKAKAGSADEVNAFLRANGFAALATLLYPGTAGIFSVKLKWQHPGQEATTIVNDTTYKAAAFKNDAVQFLQKPFHRPILKLATSQPGWSVYITESPGFKGHAKSLATAGYRLLNTARKATPTHTYTKAVIPVAKLETEVDVSMFLGLQKGWLTTEEARKLIRFEFDHLGASAEAAFYAATRGFSLEKEYRITQPYVMVFAKDGLDEAAFTAYVAKDAFVAYTN